MPAEAVATARAYTMTLRVSAVEEAATLAHELELRGALVEQDGEVVTTVWRASEADHPESWDEREFPELRFFLRAWAGLNAARQLVVLDERPVTC
ncbi:MAG: hypothetical protein ACTHKS_14590 [Gaiellaceae bacterium]